VWGLAVNSAAVYASGEFTNAGGVDAADKIASFSGGTWSPVGTSSAFGDGANAIYGIALDGQTVFAVGGFLNADGRPRLDGIAAFWYGSWRNVGTDAAGTNGPASGQMRAIQVLGNRLYVGGLDTAIGGGALNEGVASYLLRQPDAVIGPSLGDYVGDHIFNATGKGQTLKLKVARNGTGTFVIGLYNDGFATESFTAKGGASGHGFRAAYSAGPDDITAQVTAGTYVTYSLPPGAFDVIFLKVHVARSVAPGASRSFLVTETSSGPGHAKDAVKAVVTAR